MLEQAWWVPGCLPPSPVPLCILPPCPLTSFPHLSFLTFIYFHFLVTKGHLQLKWNPTSWLTARQTVYMMAPEFLNPGLCLKCCRPWNKSSFPKDSGTSQRLLFIRELKSLLKLKKKIWSRTVLTSYEVCSFQIKFIIFYECSVCDVSLLSKIVSFRQNYVSWAWWVWWLVHCQPVRTDSLLGMPVTDYLGDISWYGQICLNGEWQVYLAVAG